MEAKALNFSQCILYEDKHVCLVYKAAGIPSQSDSSRDSSLLDYGKAYLKQRYNKPGNAYLSLAHRLDRPVAGLCILAKTSKAMQRLSRAFQNHEVQKYYLAIVEGHTENDAMQQGFSNWAELSSHLRKNSANNKSYPCKQNDVGAKLAQLKYNTVARGQNYSIVAVRLNTGRHHQIRCQLAAIGHPVRGDLKYGARRSNPDKGISLYAFALKLPMPVATSDAQYKYATIAENKLKSVCLPWQVGHENAIWKLCQSDAVEFLENILD